MSRASKHLIQSKIQTKRHRLRGGEKASRESQKQASKGIFFAVSQIYKQSIPP